MVFFSAMTSITAGVLGYIDTGMVGLAIVYALIVGNTLIITKNHSNHE